MWPTRAFGSSSRTASSIPRPARSTGTTTTPRRRAGHPPVRAVSARNRFRGHVARGFGREQQADANRHPLEDFGGGVDASQRRQRIMDDQVFDDMQRHGQLYRISFHMLARAAILLLTGAVVLGQAAPRA